MVTDLICLIWEEDSVEDLSGVVLNSIDFYQVRRVATYTSAVERRNKKYSNLACIPYCLSPSPTLPPPKYISFSIQVLPNLSLSIAHSFSRGGGTGLVEQAVAGPMLEANEI